MNAESIREVLALHVAGTRVCEMEGCGLKHLAKGLCRNHYAASRRSGRPDLGQRIDRMSQLTEAGCWQWNGSVSQSGYAYMRVGDKRARAHRVAYEFFVGPIPEGLVLDHLCRNRACVNPAHLEPVTGRVNVLRGVSWAARNASKTHCINGHEFTPANTYINPRRGNRSCRACSAASARRAKARRAKAGA